MMCFRSRTLFAAFLAAVLLILHPVSCAAKSRQIPEHIAKAAKEAAAAAKVKHVVILMMENRSFDHMVGMLSDKDHTVEGCGMNNTSPACTNPDPANGSQRVHTGNKAVYIQPEDPHHSVNSTCEQMFRQFEFPEPTSVPPMDGFIQNYARYNSPSNGGGAFIMECFAPEHVPVISTLIEEYALFNKWHAAVPGPTMVNRAYAHSATSHGATYNNVLDILAGYPQRTIFEDLDEAGADWRVYFELIPATLQFKYTRTKLLSNFKFYGEFAKDAAAGNLPTYTWIEPSYAEAFGAPARDQHPDHDVALGEELIREVYEAVRSSPLWNDTLLLITYDEHGGFFDHVPPPTAPNPDGIVGVDPPFHFERLGIRVPAIAVSRWTRKGTRIGNPPASNSTDENVYFEHSSIPKTLHRLFAPNAAPLTKREVFAAPFDQEVLNLDVPRTDCPMTLPAAPSHRALSGLNGALHGLHPVTDLQHELMYVAAGAAGERGLVDEIETMPDEDAAARYMARTINKLLGKEVVPMPPVRPSWLRSSN